MIWMWSIYCSAFSIGLPQCPIKICNFYIQNKSINTQAKIVLVHLGRRSVKGNYPCQTTFVKDIKIFTVTTKQLGSKKNVSTFPVFLAKWMDHINPLQLIMEDTIVFAECNISQLFVLFSNIDHWGVEMVPWDICDIKLWIVKQSAERTDWMIYEGF